MKTKKAVKFLEKVNDSLVDAAKEANLPKFVMSGVNVGLALALATLTSDEFDDEDPKDVAMFVIDSANEQMLGAMMCDVVDSLSEVIDRLEKED